MTPPITIRESVTLDEPIDDAWGLITQPESVISCVPGAEIISMEADGAIRGAISISLGPTTTRFQGRVAMDFDHSEHTGRMRGQGADGPGRTRAIIDSEFALTPDETCADRSVLTIDSTVTVSGALAGFAATGGTAVARRLLRDFADNLGQLPPTPADVDGARPAPTASPAPAAARPISLAGLVLRSARDSLRRLFRRRSSSRTHHGEQR